MKLEYLINILGALSPIVVALLGWVSVKLSGLIKAKTNNAMLEGVLVRLNDTIWAAVKDAEQTMRVELTKAKADGDITKEEYAHIKASVVANIRAHLGMKGLLEIMSVLGLDDNGVTKLIGSKVEAAVLDMKEPTVNPLP